MDSGLGSDEDRRISGGRGATKEQKQLHNERLLSGCFIDASSLTDDGDAAERRRDERRQGALIFQTSIPQFSMLQMSSSEDNFPVAPSSSRSSVPPAEPATPFNSIVQLDTSRKSPLGFYVDLNDVPDEPPPSSSATRKNIFSMVIDFEAPKKDMPTRLSSSLIARRKVRDKKPGKADNGSLSAASSSSSCNGENADAKNGCGGEEAARNSSSSSLCSSNNAEGAQGTSASDINDVKVEESAEEEREEVRDEEVGQVEEKDEEEQKEVAEEKGSPEKEQGNGNPETQVRIMWL